MIYVCYEGTTGEWVATFYSKPHPSIFNTYKNYIELEKEPVFENKEAEGLSIEKYVDINAKELKCRYVKTPQKEIPVQERLQALEKSNAEMMNLIAQLTMPTP